MSDGFKLDELAKLEKDVLELAKKYPKHVKKFLQKEGNQLKKTVVKNAKSKVGKKTGNYIKGFKRGKVYKYDGDDTIRVYNSKPHAHLIEYGHVIKDKTGKEHGFKKGYHILEDSEREYRDKFIQAMDGLIDDIINDGGF